MTDSLATHDDADLADLFGHRILWMIGLIVADVSCLLPEERTVIEHAVPKRQREFASGRLYARTVLSRLGFPEAPLLPGLDRAPVWPAGAVGSISHSRRMAGAAVALKSHYGSVGLDIEDREPVASYLLNLIASADEREWVERGSSADAGVRARLLFSAKESVYKCHYPVYGVFLEFRDVRIQFDEATRSFQAQTLPLPHRATRDVLNGRFWMGETTLVTVTDLPAHSGAR